MIPYFGLKSYKNGEDPITCETGVYIVEMPCGHKISQSGML